MKLTIGVTLALMGCAALVSLAALGRGVEMQDPLSVTNSYSSGPASVTISTRTGQVLSVLNVPTGVELSVHLMKGESTLPDDKTGTLTFSGAVSIRTRPRSELKSGVGLREQMMNAPLRLDVQDAVVVLTRNR